MDGEVTDDVRAIRRAVQRLSRRLRAERPSGGLTDVQLQVLAAIMDCGPLTSGGLAAFLRTSPQALTRTITALTEAGLLHREPVPSDNRQYLLMISPTGWRALAADAAPRDAWLTAALGSLTDAERGLLVLAAPLMTRLAEEPT